MFKTVILTGPSQNKEYGVGSINKHLTSEHYSSTYKLHD